MRAVFRTIPFLLLLASCASPKLSFRPFDRLAELSSSYPAEISSFDVAVEVRGGQAYVYRRSGKSKWEAVHGRQDIIDSAKNSFALLLAERDTRWAEIRTLVDACNVYDLATKVSIPCSTEAGFTLLQVSGPELPPRDAAGYDPERMILLLNSPDAASLQEEMRKLGKERMKYLLPDGTCRCLFVDKRTSNNAVFEIKGIRLSQEACLAHVWDFTKWCKQQDYPPIACTFTIHEQTDMQQLAENILLMYEAGVGRVGISTLDSTRELDR
jgi:hypothetical protein